MCLKNAGTLRYKHEICHVIMVAMEDDVNAISPSMYGEPRFKQDGFIDQNRKINDLSHPPGFQITHPFTKYWGYYCSWETLAFALYFPDNSQKNLECPNSSCKERKIGHTYCTSTQPYQGTWICPNDIYFLCAK